jgi:hypothetical protein
MVMNNLEKKAFTINPNIASVGFSLDNLVNSIKIKRVYIELDLTYLATLNQSKFRDLYLISKSINTRTGELTKESISLFSPNIGSANFFCISIDRTFPEQNVGITNNTDLPFNEISFSIEGDIEVIDNAIFRIEFDSRPGGYHDLEKYCFKITKTKKQIA